MSNSDANASSGSVMNAASGDSAVNNQTEIKKEKDTVAYETHFKLLAEKKKRDSELAEAHAKLKELEENKLKEKEDYKTLLSLRDKELTAANKKLSDLEDTLNNSVKLDSVLKKIPGTVAEQYFGLFDLSKIPIDPATQMPDQLALEKYAKEFEMKYPHIIQKANSAQMPNDAAKGNGAKLNYDEWLKLPLKEQKARLREVM